MTQLANLADEGNQDAIKKYNEFIKNFTFDRLLYIDQNQNYPN